MHCVSCLHEISIVKILSITIISGLIAASTLGAAAAPDVSLTVMVRTHEGETVANAYVSLVPAWRPTSRPLAEMVGDGRDPTLRVPEGNYWIVAGAPGLGVVSQGPVAVSPSSRSVTVRLQRLESASGTVTDDAGAPIRGARVARINGVVPPPLGTLSAMAVRHLGAGFSTVTDDQGRWTLNLPTGKVPIFFEAPGFATEARMVDAGARDAGVVPLSKAATLELTIDRIDPSIVVTLAREDAGAESIPADEQPRIWAKWADAATLTWISLGPGSYSVYAKYPDPRYFMDSAVRLGTFTLARGERRVAQVTLPRAKEAAPRAAVAFLPGVSKRDLGEDLAVFETDPAGRANPLDHLAEPTVGGTTIYASAGPGFRGPLFGASSARFFFAEPVVSDFPHPTVSIATLHKRADAELTLRFSDETLQPPPSGSGVFRECDDAKKITVPIRIAEGKLARLTAPAECRGAVLEFAPYEPIPLPESLKPGRQSLGEFILRGAASAEVHVMRDPGGPLAGAAVRVIADASPASVLAEATTDEAGWARLSALPAGRDLRIFAISREGDASETVTAILQPREHVVIDPLSVPEPATLIVETRIGEDVAARLPGTRVSTLFITPSDPYRGFEKQQREGPAPDVPTRFERLHPGRWTVVAVVKLAGTYAFHDLETVELKPGETRRLVATIEPNVFEGIVTSGAEGVAARIHIDENGRRLFFNSDSSGHFRAPLQAPGIYRVAIARLRDQGNIIPIGEVAFTDPSQTVEIEIPRSASAIARVRIGERPLPRAIVWISRREPSGTVDRMTKRGQTTNETGEARFADLSPGTWTFSVLDPDSRRGAEKTITVAEAEDARLDLDLASASTIEGSVYGPGGVPLPSAPVECLFVGPTGNPDRAATRSDPAGAFRLDLVPPGPPIALCSVIGPMGAVDAFRARPGQPADVILGAPTGALRIQDWAEERAPDLWWLVAPDGRAISLRAVAARIGMPGYPLIIPALAAGPWHIVRAASLPDWLALATGLGYSLTPLAEATIEVGRTDEVALRH